MSSSKTSLEINPVAWSLEVSDGPLSYRSHPSSLLTLPKFVKFQSVSLASFCLSALFALNPVAAQNLPYATSFLGNTWGQGATGDGGKWMQDNIDGLWVKPDGTCYTNSFWDEAGNNGGIYKDGELVGRLAFSHDDFSGGVGITGDESAVYAGNWMNIIRFGFDGTILAQVPASKTPTKDKARSVKGLAADSPHDLLFATQDLDNQVQVWKKSSLTLLRSWPLDRPGACATAGDGTVWVAQVADASKPGNVLHYDSMGNFLHQQINGDKGFDPQALCFDAKGRLLVADNGPDQNVKIYSLGDLPSLVSTFGTTHGIFSGTPGEVGPLKFSGLTGIGVDSSGTIYVGQNNVGKAAFWNGGGSILESYTESGTRNWEIHGLEFVDCASADRASENGDSLDVYSKYNHYALDLSKTKPGSEATWKGHTLNQFKYPNDQRYTRANDNFDYTGGTAIRTIGGKKIMFVFDMQARRLLWYRFQPDTDGEIAVPAGLIEQNAYYNITYPGSPAEKEFIWCDANGNGQTEKGEYASGPGTPNLAYGWWVDSRGDIWQCNNYNDKIGLRHWKAQGLNKFGVPIYDYDPAHYEAFARPPNTHGDLKRVIYFPETDTMILSSWSVTADRDAGDRVTRFNNWSRGNRTAAWDIKIPRATAITAEGDYMFVAYGGLGNDLESGKIDVYRLGDGIKIGRIHAGPEVMSIEGAMDIPYGVSAYKRPNGEYLIFEEDDWHAKLLLYRWQNPHLMTDTLEDWSKLNGGSHTDGWGFDTSNAALYCDGDRSRAVRKSDDLQSIVYKYKDITDFTASIYAGIDHSDPVTLGVTKFYASANGTDWAPVAVTPVTRATNKGTWKLYNYVPSETIPAGTNYLKIEFGPGAGHAYDPQLAQLSLKTSETITPLP